MAQTVSKASFSKQHLTDLYIDQYTKNYCEENIYWLAHSFSGQSNLSNLFVVFISNQSQQIPIWSQRASMRPDGLVVWDYHVILLALPSSKNAEDITTTRHENQLRESESSLIFDLDSMLPSPIPSADYVRHALVINSSELERETHRRLFRVIPAASYLANFASDRSHMLKRREEFESKNDGGAAAGAHHIDDNNTEYMSPPPSYPCIISRNGDTNTFPSYLEMPSYSQAMSNWKETPLEKFTKTESGSGSGSGGHSDTAPLGDIELPYGMVLTEDAFLDFATRVTVL